MKNREAAIESVSWMESLSNSVNSGLITEETALEIATDAGNIARRRYSGADDLRLEIADRAIQAYIAQANATRQGYPNA